MKENKEYAWWVGERPFNNTFSSIEEAIEDFKFCRDTDNLDDTDYLGDIEVVFIGEVEHFDYHSAAVKLFEDMKYSFENIYDDWQGSLDDDRVWWMEDDEPMKHMIHEIEDYLIHKTDFSVKMKATPICCYNNKEDKIEGLDYAFKKSR